MVRRRMVRHTGQVVPEERPDHLVANSRLPHRYGGTAYGVKSRSEECLRAEGSAVGSIDLHAPVT